MARRGDLKQQLEKNRVKKDLLDAKIKLQEQREKAAELSKRLRNMGGR